MEIALAAGTLRAAYQLLIVGIRIEQVPNAVRRCIELVRTCHRDLEDLIKLRNESLPMLESKPAILERINTIIENAHNGLLEVARLVEKLRPEAHDGSSPLMGRLEWMFIDSREFSSQEPLISRQHSSVIAELNFLRQLILLAPLIDRSGSDQDRGGAGQTGKKRSAIAWDNVGLLDEMMGGRRPTMPQPNSPPTAPAPVFTPSSITTHQTTPTSRVVSPTPSVIDPPPPYTSPRPTPSSPTTFPPSTTTNPLIYNVQFGAPGSGAAVAGSMDSIYTGQTNPSTEKMKKTTVSFDPDGISFLFGDLKIAPKPAAVSAPITGQIAQTASTSSGTNTPSAPGRWSAPVPSSAATSDSQSNSPQTPPAKIPLIQSPALQPTFSTAVAPQIQSRPQPQPQQDHQPQSPHRPQPDHQPPQQPRRQPPPVPSKQGPASKIKPLSTIPQELIHRHDGVQSPPIQPILPHIIGATPLHVNPGPTPPISSITSHPVQRQTWGPNTNDAKDTSPDPKVECCTTCGSARSSLHNFPISTAGGHTSLPSNINISVTQPFQAIPSPPISQTSNPYEQAQHQHQPQHQRQNSLDQFRSPSPSRPESWVQLPSRPNTSYATTPHTSSTTGSMPVAQGIPAFDTNTPNTNPKTDTHHPVPTEEEWIPRMPKNMKPRRPVSSLDLRQENTNKAAATTHNPGQGIGLLQNVSTASLGSLLEPAYIHPTTIRSSTPQPNSGTTTSRYTYPGQSTPLGAGPQQAHVQPPLAPPPLRISKIPGTNVQQPPAAGSTNSSLNLNPGSVGSVPVPVHMFATVREHWRPETLTGTLTQPQQQTNILPVHGVSITPGWALPNSSHSRHLSGSVSVQSLNATAASGLTQGGPHAVSMEMGGLRGSAANDNMGWKAFNVNVGPEQMNRPHSSHGSGQNTHVAELYGSSVPVNVMTHDMSAEQQCGTGTGPGSGAGAGYGMPQPERDGKTYPGSGMIHTQIHELPSVKFAPDPVELE